MPAEEVEVILRILVLPIEHAVKLEVHMRIMNRKVSFVAKRIVATIYLDVTKGIVIIGKIPNMGLDIAMHFAFIDGSLRIEIEGDGAKFRLIQQSTHTEFITHDVRIEVHMLER